VLLLEPARAMTKRSGFDPPDGPANEELLLSRPHAVDCLEQLKMPCLPFPTD
jgi:hypothetical protein